MTRFLPVKLFARVSIRHQGWDMPHQPPLMIIEEFMLLALNEDAGTLWPVSRSALDCATACAVLMDLMELRRVDCDVRHLFITDAEPVGNDILDPVLRVLAVEPVRSTRAIIDELSFLEDEGEVLRERVLQRLVERGVFRLVDRKILWLFGSRHYVIINDHDIRGVKLRILQAVLGDAIPDPHDIALVSLAYATGLFPYILSASELAHAQTRIQSLAQMDVLGRAAAENIAEIDASIAMASGLR